MGCHTWFKKGNGHEVDPDVYHDCFRLGHKSLTNVFAYSDIKFKITSREQTHQFIEDHKEHIRCDNGCKELINDFWDRYPNGWIEFS